MQLQKDIDEYEWQLVTTEATQCSCGSTHERGHTLWGGMFKPEEMGDHDPTRGVRSIHDAEMELIHKV